MIPQIKTFNEYQEAWKASRVNPQQFWADIASTYTWSKPWNQVLDADFSTAQNKWFIGGQLNITENCLDRHLVDKADQPALIWEPNTPGDPAITYTYEALYKSVCRFANALKNQGVQKGDRVVLYMPMVPELTIAVLACARIGAIHSVVFAGFSAQALADRINDATAKIVICSDVNFRGTKVIPVLELVDEALDLGCPSIERRIIFTQSDRQDIKYRENIDISWADALLNQSDNCPAEPMDAEDILFILYTSGSTGKPKGVVHTCGGYMVYAGYSFNNVFQYQPGDVYWCTADVGWITGHSYIIYGPLLAGATTLMFEGVPTYPDAGRFWAICQRHNVNQFYTAPTAIRALMAQGDAFVERYDLTSLKTIGTVGEPINEEAWHWYNEVVGNSRCALVDTWWQTETGGIMLSGLGGLSPAKPGCAGLPLPGIQPVLLDADGFEILTPDTEGYLCIKAPWPSMIRTIYGDHERCKSVYFSAFKEHYFTGDSAKRTKEGLYKVIGRVDDVLNVSGHRLGTAEIENAVNSHLHVVESAVIGVPHEIKGEVPQVFVVLDTSIEADVLLVELNYIIARLIGKIAQVAQVYIVPGLPKTRSGKIMRRILRKLSKDIKADLGDNSTLLNPDIVAVIRDTIKKID